MGARHMQIEQNHIEGNGLLPQRLQSRQRVGFMDGGIDKAGGYRLFQGSAEKGMVIGYQYCCHGPDLSMKEKKMLPFGRPAGQRGKNRKQRVPFSINLWPWCMGAECAQVSFSAPAHLSLTD